MLYEYWVVATRPTEANGLGMEPVSVDQAIQKWMNVFKLLLDERSIFVRWRELVLTHDVKGKTAHDARLVAAMQQHGIENLLTFNVSDFARFPAINVYSPTDVLAGRLSL